MRAQVGAVGLLVVGALAGCASAIPSGTGTGSDAAALRSDSFLPYDEVQTEVQHTAGTAEKTSMALIARRDRSTAATTTHALVGVSYVGLNPRHYTSARNQRAVALPLTIVRRAGSNCRSNVACVHMESFRIEVPETDLRAAQAAGQGYPLKLYTQAGASILFPITREQVAALARTMAAWPRATAIQSAGAVARH